LRAVRLGNFGHRCDVERLAAFHLHRDHFFCVVVAGDTVIMGRRERRQASASLCDTQFRFQLAQEGMAARRVRRDVAQINRQAQLAQIGGVRACVEDLREAQTAPERHRAAISARQRSEACELGLPQYLWQALERVVRSGGLVGHYTPSKVLHQPWRKKALEMPYDDRISHRARPPAV
jgi:hypothetical protein